MQSCKYALISCFFVCVFKNDIETNVYVIPKEIGNNGLMTYSDIGTLVSDDQNLLEITKDV